MSIEKEDDKEYIAALDDLGLNKEDMEEREEMSFNEGGDNKILEVQNIAREYKATMEGRSRVDQDDAKKIVFRQTGRALASKNFIHLTYSMLYSFADASNIASSKDMDQFFIQFKDAFNKAQNMALRDITIDDKDHSPIITIFKHKMLNIGQIITADAGNMKLLLERYKQESEDGNYAFDTKGSAV